MKVNTTGQKQIQASKSHLSNKVEADAKSIQNKATQALNPSNAAKVDLSEKAQRMGKAESVARTTDTSQPNKVKRLQQLIDSGQYKVDAASVADRLVDSHLFFPED